MSLNRRGNRNTRRRKEFWRQGMLMNYQMTINVQFIIHLIITEIGLMTGKNIAQINKLLAKTDSHSM